MNSDVFLHIGLVQFDIQWRQKQKNLNRIEALINQTTDSVDLFVLPEMFNTGFYPSDLSQAETLNGESVSFLISLARKNHTAICGSLCIQEKDQYYNTFVLVDEKGIQATYRKKHVFTFAKEDSYITPGTNIDEFNWHASWQIRPFICYDIRFPVWLRNTTSYDVLLGVANFPKKRIHHWQQLCIARAIENQSYVVSVNALGVDPDGIEYGGHSLIVDPDGQILVNAHEEIGVFKYQLSKSVLSQYRQQFPFLKDRDHFSILGNESI